MTHRHSYVPIAAISGVLAAVLLAAQPAYAGNGDGVVTITVVSPPVGPVWPISPTNPYIFTWTGSPDVIVAQNVSGTAFKDMHVYVFRDDGFIINQESITLTGPNLAGHCARCNMLDANFSQPYPLGDKQYFTISVAAFLIDRTYKIKVAPSIPEPANWALMIGGFGLVGGAARYRRRQAA